MQMQNVPSRLEWRIFKVIRSSLGELLSFVWITCDSMWGCLFDCTRHHNSQASACDAETNKGVACSLNKAWEAISANGYQWIPLF